MDRRKKFMQWRVLVGSCAFLLGLGAFPGVPCAFGQEKPVGSDTAQRDITGRSAQTPSAGDRQSFENLMHLIRNGGGLWSASSTVKPRSFFLSSNARHFPTFELARPISASRFAFARVINWSTAINRSAAAVTTRASNMPLISFTCPAGGTCWVGGASGVWSTSGNWSNGVPTSSTNVLIDNGNANLQGASAVTLNIAGVANNLTVNSDDTLNFNDNTSLTVNGTSISNAGSISLNSSNNPTDLIIAGNNSVTLSGGGTLTMGNNGANRVYSAGGTGTLINQETIQGGGQLGVNQLTLDNQGTINANVGTPLIVQPGSGGVTNTATMEASSGGTLDLQGSYTNTGGLIEALAGSTVKLDGATITGGTLTTSGGGVMGSINSVTLKGVTISTGSVYSDPDNTSTTLQGTITNNGNIQLNSSNNATDLHISGPVTLTGTGTVTMGNNGANRIFAPNGTDTLTNKQTERLMRT
jgi:hypothetical protein